MSPMVYIAEEEVENYSVYCRNGSYLGALKRDRDGYYKYWPSKQAGYWDESMMRGIANLLDHVNGPWDE